jgi:predicted DNA binding CopG/RHH family protein
MPRFVSEDEEAKWWAGAEGREFLKRQSAAGKSRKRKGSPLVSALSHAASVQIALRLHEADLDRLRRLAAEKGLPYQTYMKSLLHEALAREERRRAG